MKKSIVQHKTTFKTLHRDLTWLSFNERVLQEAMDPSVPLLERLKFLGIYSNNGDEFFRVRVAALKRLQNLGIKAKKLTGYNVDKVLNQIQKKVISLQEKFEDTYNFILSELEKNNIFILNEKQLNTDQAKFVRQHFHDKVLSALVPIMVDGVSKFPFLKDKTLYLFVVLSHSNIQKKSKFAVIEVPTQIMSRFVVLPGDQKYIILLEDVIRFCLDDIFHFFNYDAANAFAIKISRDAELDIDNDVNKSLVRKISDSVKKRKKGNPTRLIYDEEIPAEALTFILKKMNIKNEDTLLPGGRYHNHADFINFPQIGPSHLHYKYPPPLDHIELKPQTSILQVLKKKDILLSFPYQSYNYIIDLLREAAIDPKVISISITLYRVAKNSNVVNALINAIKNGKKVTVLVELQARFDEENNINAGNRLADEGAKVIYGVPGLKAHTKLFVISRKENAKIVRYAHIGTGNFNEDTARIYCDHSLLTCDKRITDEVERIFDFYNNNYKTGAYKNLLVAPFFMRKKIIGLIAKEIENAQSGKPAWIFLKMNSLSDEEMIHQLYEAGNAGVKIRLIVRSICSLIPGVAGLSENIQARSIVDKYLEHARVFIFCNNNDEKMYLSSADLMTRNLDFRSEVAVPIYDRTIQKQLKDILEIQWSDNIKARIIAEKQTNQYVRDAVAGKRARVRSQDEIYNYHKNLLPITIV